LTFLDTNVVLDLARPGQAWTAWSTAQLRECRASGALIANDVVWAEVSAGFADEAATDSLFAILGITLERTPRAALFLAARAHAAYRHRGGTRTGVLPDFFIGAQALTLGARLLTRDARRFREYFPTLELITPPPEG
jgi:predicted nucleic acid-binding protein